MNAEAAVQMNAKGLYIATCPGGENSHFGPVMRLEKQASALNPRQGVFSDG